jgi:hypothetical protein
MRQGIWMAVAAMMRPVRSVPLAIVALLGLVGCSAGALAVCTSAGGTYAAGTCTRSSAELEAAERRCRARGAVYLSGQDICVLGAGGP